MTSLPTNPGRRSSLTRRVRHAGLRFETSILEQLVDREPGNLEYLAALGEAYTRLRRYAKGLDVDRRLVAADPADPIYRYNLACSLALTSDLDGACAALLKAFELGYSDFDHLMRDPDLRRLRGDVRFGLVREQFERLHGPGTSANA